MKTYFSVLLSLLLTSVAGAPVATQAVDGSSVGTKLVTKPLIRRPVTTTAVTTSTSTTKPVDWAPFKTAFVDLAQTRCRGIVKCDRCREMKCLPVKLWSTFDYVSAHRSETTHGIEDDVKWIYNAPFVCTDNESAAVTMKNFMDDLIQKKALTIPDYKTIGIDDCDEPASASMLTALTFFPILAYLTL